MNDSEEVKEGNEYDYTDCSFTLLQFLPTIYECVQAIVNHAPSYGKIKQKVHIHQFALQLVDLWQKAFGRVVALAGVNWGQNWQQYTVFECLEFGCPNQLK